MEYLLKMVVVQLEKNADSNGQERIDLVNKTKRVSLGSGVKIKKKNSKHGDGGFYTYCLPHNFCLHSCDTLCFSMYFWISIY